MPQTVSYIDAKGNQRELILSAPMTLARESFCTLVAYGAAPIDAYMSAYGKAPASNAVEAKTYHCSAANLMADSDVKVRIMELRRPIQRKLAKKWEYKLDHAFDDLQKAWDLAYVDADTKSLTKIVELKAKLAKILSDEVNVHHTHGILDKETTEVLLAMKEAMRRKKGHAKVIEANEVKELGNGAADPPEPRL